MSRSKIVAANIHRLRASSLVVSHGPEKRVSKKRTSPARIISYIVATGRTSGLEIVGQDKAGAR